MNFKRLIATAVLVTMLVAPGLAAAQDDTSTPETTPILDEAFAPAPVPELETAFERIVGLINDISFLPWASALVLLLTQLVKRFVTSVRPVVIAMAIQVVIWIAYAVANHFGYGQNIQLSVEALTKIIEAILTIAPAMLVSAAATEVAFRGLRRQDVPMFKAAA